MLGAAPLLPFHISFRHIIINQDSFWCHSPIRVCVRVGFCLVLYVKACVCSAFLPHVSHILVLDIAISLLPFCYIQSFSIIQRFSKISFYRLNFKAGSHVPPTTAQLKPHVPGSQFLTLFFPFICIRCPKNKLHGKFPWRVKLLLRSTFCPILSCSLPTQDSSCSPLHLSHLSRFLFFVATAVLWCPEHRNKRLLSTRFIFVKLPKTKPFNFPLHLRPSMKTIKLWGWEAAIDNISSNFTDQISFPSYADLWRSI